MASTSKRKAQSSRRGRHARVKVVENALEAGAHMPMYGHGRDLGHIVDQCPSIVGRYDEVQMLQGNRNMYWVSKVATNRFSLVIRITIKGGTTLVINVTPRPR
ncbi:hypothetical protein HanIR_Chr13g0623561 [Helianthus annuus]|nr:hypothetical protein HanIR_Chr13g0623561 [Helianthus annuus]